MQQHKRKKSKISCINWELDKRSLQRAGYGYVCKSKNKYFLCFVSLSISSGDSSSRHCRISSLKNTAQNVEILFFNMHYGIVWLLDKWKLSWNMCVTQNVWIHIHIPNWLLIKTWKISSIGRITTAAGVVSWQQRLLRHFPSELWVT